jgi:anti-sigma-K factor RskA
MNYRDSRRRAALAAEYALGTLRGPAKRRFERLLRDDFTLREEVQRWQNDLYPPLLEALPEQPPPDRVWQAVDQQTRPDVPSRAKPDRPASGGFWQNPGFWRGWAALASAALLVLVLYQTLQGPAVTPQPAYVAVVTDSANRPAWLIQISDDYTLGVRTLQAQRREADRSFELWLLPDGERGPVSLGLLPASGDTELDLEPAARQLLSSATGLAVSLEPAGGSPEDGPTGPILYQGPLAPAAAPAAS